MASTLRVFVKSLHQKPRHVVYLQRRLLGSALTRSQATVNLVPTQVDWAAETKTNRARLRGNKGVQGSHSAKFPEFLATPRAGYPHVFTPAAEVKATPEEWAGPVRKVLKDYLENRDEGAVLFRNLPLSTSQDFSRMVSCLGLQTMEYIGTAVRDVLAEGVSSASNEPPEFCVEPHNELSYLNRQPEKLFFCCLEPPAPGTGGESVMVDVREMLPKLDPAVVDKFRRLGIQYWMDFPSRGDGIYISWQEIYHTEDKAEVEKYMKENNMKYRWSSHGSLWTCSEQPAMKMYRGQDLWFNQPSLYHPSFFKNHPDWVKDPDKPMPYEVFFGDGSEIPEEWIQHLREVTWQVAVGYQMQKGDLMVLNNMYVEHGRLPFTERRKLAVALTM